MRTTITLDKDVEALVRRVMRERGLTFKQAVNMAIKQGLTTDSARTTFRTPTFRMGAPRGSLTHALRLSAELEDEELARRVSARK